MNIKSVKRLKNGEIRAIRVSREALREVARETFRRNMRFYFDVYDEKPFTAYFDPNTHELLFAVYENPETQIDVHKLMEFFPHPEVSLGDVGFYEIKYKRLQRREDGSYAALDGNKKDEVVWRMWKKYGFSGTSDMNRRKAVKHLKDDEIRAICIPKTEVWDIIKEYFQDNICRYFDIIEHPRWTCFYDENTGDMVFATDDTDVMDWENGVSAEELMKVIPYTTDSFFTNGRCYKCLRRDTDGSYIMLD